MGQPAATATSMVVGLDTHMVLVPTPGGPVPVPLPHPFQGQVVAATVPTVMINGLPAAVVGSVAAASPPHLPTPPGVAFAVPPTSTGTVLMGSPTVLVGGLPAARNADPVQTCNDPVPAPVSQLVAPSPTVTIG